MSKILVTGYLTDPLDRPAADVRIRVTATDNLGQTLEHTTAEVITDSAGHYSFDLVYGHYTVEIYITDTYEVTGLFFVNEGTPTEIDMLTLIHYSEVLEPEVLIPGSTDWENIHEDVREGIDTSLLTLPNQLSDGNTTVAETKEVFSNDRLGSTLGQDTQDLLSEEARVTKQPTVYSDKNGRRSATDGTKLTTGNATTQQTQELYKSSDGLVDMVLTREGETANGTIVDNITLSERDNTASINKAVTVGTTGRTEEVTLSADENSSRVSGGLERVDVTLGTTAKDTMQVGYLNDDSVMVDGAYIESSKATSLDTGTHTASIYDEQKALVDIDDLLQIVQEKGITAYDKVLYERQTVKDGSLTVIEKNPDVYDITDTDGVSVFTVDTVTKRVELNARLVVNNPGDFKGEAGDTIFEVYQYSADKTTWFDAWVTGYNWRRHATSVNGNVSAWSEPYTMVGEDGRDGDTYYNEYQYATSSKNGPWHDEYIDEDMYRRWRTVSLGSTPTAWQIEVMRGSNGVDGEIVSIVYQYSVDGFDPWHTDFMTGDHYRRERTNYYKTADDQLNDSPYLTSPWSSPTQIVPVNGKDYFNGVSQVVLYLYQRSLGGAPALPTETLTYNFVTTDLTGELGGWSTGVPSGTDTVWITAATASSTTDTDEIPSTEWVTPEILGSSPYNQANIAVYKRSASVPSAPTTELEYDFTTGALTGDLEGWQYGSLPDGDADLYMATASVIAQYTLATIAPDDWGVGILTSNVFKQESVHIYLRADALPPAPSSDVTYNFTDGTITGLTGGWTRILPDGSDDIYIGVAVASGSGNTDVITSSNWSIGLLGASGYQTVNLNLYSDSDTEPSPPTNELTYSFADKRLIVQPDNGWVEQFPTNTTGKIWVIAATANGPSLDESDIIPASEWTEPTVYIDAGMQVATVTLYRIADAVLGDGDLPTQDLTYSFETGSMITTPDNGWSTRPVSNTSTVPVWITTATVTTKTVNATDIIYSGEWTTPVVLVKSGSTIYEVYQYSVDGVSDWHTEFRDDDIYRRTALSTDGVLGDWSVAKLGGVDGAPGDTIWIDYQYSPDMVNWHPVLEPLDIYRKEAIVTNGVWGDYSAPARITGNTESIIYEYSINGSYNWHSNFSTGDHYRRESNVLNGELGEWSEAVQIVPIKDVDYNDGKGGDTIYEIYQYSIDGLGDWHDDFRSEDYYRRTAVVVSGEMSEWSDPAKVSGEDGESILVRLSCAEGFFFKNNTGNVKKIVAEVWLDGVLVEDVSAYNFHWRVGDDTVYTTNSGDYVSVIPTASLYPANGEAEGGINFESIFVDFSDVADGSNLNLTCEVTNI